MSRRRRIVLWSLGACITLLLLVVLLGPLLIRRQASGWVAEHTRRTLRIEKILLNPLNLSVEIRGVQLSGIEGDSDLLAFERLRLALSLRSIIDRALILRRITLDGLRLNLERTAPNHYNFDDLLALAQPEPGTPAPTAPDEPLHFSLNNIELHDGTILLIDRAVAPEKSHAVTDLSLSIPFIGNVSYLEDQFVTPQLRGTLNGTPLLFEGRLKPFQDGAETLLEVNLKGLDLAAYTAYYPGELPLRLRSGRLDTDLALSYRVSRQSKPEISMNGRVGLNGVALDFPDGRPLLALADLRAVVERSQPLAGEIVLAELALRAPELHLRRDNNGRWELQEIGSVPGDEPAVEPEGPPLHLQVGKLRLEGGTLHLNDSMPRLGFNTTLQQIAVAIDNFDNRGDTPGQLQFSAVSSRGEQLSASGGFTVAAPSADLLVAVDKVRLEDYYPYLETSLTASPRGVAAFKGQILFDSARGARVASGELHLQQLAVPFRPEEAFTLENADFGGVEFDQAANSAVLGSVVLTGGRLDFSRDATGNWSPLALLRPSTPKQQTAPAENPPIAWRIDSLQLRSWQVDFQDASLAERAVLRLRDLSLDTSGLVSRGPSFDQARLSGRLGRGTLQLTAAGRLEPLRLSGNLRLRQFPLPDFVPYLPPNLNLALADGAADATLAFRINRSGDQLAGTVSGKFGIRNLYALDSIDANDLLRWESLQCDDLSFDLGRPSYAIGGLILSGLNTRLIIDRDGRLNFGKLIDTPPESPPVATESTEPPAAPSPPAEIRIDAVTLQNGTIDFIDQSMSPQFRTSMLDLGGRISGLSSASDMRAEVDLRGRLENRSPLRISGQLNPLSTEPFADIRITFDDIELAPATPYSGRYLGYTIDQGKLSLALDYKLQNRQINSRNQVFIDQFTFGSEVASPDATNLPVRLAVALLKDAKGEIHLDIPVTGRSDDPQFEIWSVVWEILRNLVVKAATSPMALLGSLIGGGDEFSHVTFPAGLASLEKVERDKLASLGKVLLDRPALKLQVSGYADAQLDPEGYRREQLRLKIARAKFLEQSKNNTLTVGQSAENTEVLPEERSTYLKEAYRREKFPRPRNLIGLLKDLPAAEMEKLILANVVVGPDELAQLAWARSTAVVEFLSASGGLPKERLFQKRTELGRPKGAEAEWRGNRVEFGLATD